MLLLHNKLCFAADSTGHAANNHPRVEHCLPAIDRGPSLSAQVYTRNCTFAPYMVGFEEVVRCERQKQREGEKNSQMPKTSEQEMENKGEGDGKAFTSYKEPTGEAFDHQRGNHLALNRAHFQAQPWPSEYHSIWTPH